MPVLCGESCPLLGRQILRRSFRKLPKQWHPEKNEPLTPEQVLPAATGLCGGCAAVGMSGRRLSNPVWQGPAVPVCANRAIERGENDLTSTHPELALQWHPGRNGVLTPRDVTAGSHRKVWWMCEKGHEWQASILSRANKGTGCPVCAGRVIVQGENDLESLFPKVARQWHPTRNGALGPEKVSPYSNRRVWWMCDKGHSYQAVIASRTIRGSGCPYCAGRKVLAGFNDLKTTAPEIAEQWHPTLNGGLRAEMVTSGSRKKVWWICGEGHVWKATVYSRTGSQKSACPVCAGKVRQSRRYRYTAAWAETSANSGTSCV